MLVVMVGLLTVIFIRLFRTKLLGRSPIERIAVRAVAPTRGVIVDREGRLLAENLPSFTLALIPTFRISKRRWPS